MRIPAKIIAILNVVMYWFMFVFSGFACILILARFGMTGDYILRERLLGSFNFIMLVALIQVILFIVYLIKKRNRYILGSITICIGLIFWIMFWSAYLWPIIFPLIGCLTILVTVLEKRQERMKPTQDK